MSRQRHKTNLLSRLLVTNYRWCY